MKKVLTSQQANMVKEFARNKSRKPEQDVALLTLTCDAGLSANEMMNLEVQDVMDHSGRIRSKIEVRKVDGIGPLRARKVRGKPCVLEALEMHIRHAGIESGPLFPSAVGHPMKSDTISRRIKRLFTRCGLPKATPASGRLGLRQRMIRTAARDDRVSIRDVQVELGYAQLSQIVGFQPPSEAIMRLMGLIWEEEGAGSEVSSPPGAAAGTATEVGRAGEAARLPGPAADPGGRRDHPPVDGRDALLAAIGHANELQRALTTARKAMTRQIPV